MIESRPILDIKCRGCMCTDTCITTEIFYSRDAHWRSKSHIWQAFNMIHVTLENLKL